MKALFLPLLLLACTAHAQAYRADDHSLAFLPDGRMLVTEKAGRLRVISQGRLEPQPIGGLPQVTVHGQGGLHDVALHPGFSKNGWLYLA